MTMHCYGFTAGTYCRRFAIHTTDPKEAMRLARRWVRMFWTRHKESAPKGSLADAIDNGWHGDKPTLRVYQSGELCSAGIIPADTWALILEEPLS